MTTISPALAAFLSRWQFAGGAERANYQLFLTELCDLLNLPHPEPTTPDDSKNNYVFDRAITATNPDGSTTSNFIDLYKRAHFVLETKQGIERNADVPSASDVAQPPSAVIGQQPMSKPRRLKRGHGIRGTKLWDDSLLRAKSQAENYVRNIPDDNPPFLLVVDVGYSIETYADFSGLGKTYVPFPDNRSHRFKLTDLADPKLGPDLLDRLKKIWLDPQSLNPAKRSAKVTREIAAKLAELSKSLEKSGHHPESVAHFLMRVLFTLFAEDVHLIPNNSFTKLLEDLKDTPDKFAPMAMAVWQNMDKGGFSPVLREDLLRFNGGLFADTQALKLTGNQLELLIDAAHQDWSDVEPAIFGTLLERALDPTERHKLGAHYTPRAYVERLVLPTVIEPLREEWQTAKTTAISQANNGDLKKAIKTAGDFLKHLCSITVLDPACGSGNFLYVTLEHMKRLEGEVHDFLAQFPNTQLPLEYTGLTVDPHQLRGIEINPRAAAITDLVLWIGYLQWHFRTHADAMPAEPVLKKFDNIECRDAVLSYDSKELARDEHGKPLSRWDGTSTKKHPITGEDVPNESAQIPIYRYIHAKKADWPKADYVIGNPPFLGTKRMRAVLGDEYVQTLRDTYRDVMEDNADFVMFWWVKAAILAKRNEIRRFGFITTNSLKQSFSRRVLDQHLDQNLRLTWAIPDHPWSDAESGADVRISMTCASSDRNTVPRLVSVIREDHQDSEDAAIVEFAEQPTGKIHSDLRIGADITSCKPLAANKGLAAMGVALHGAGFVVDPQEAQKLRKGGSPEIIRPFISGRDLVQDRRERYVIDFTGMDESQARRKNPAAFQHLIDHVLPERKVNARETIRRLWWRFGWERPELQRAIQELSRYIATSETAKHRIFTFLEHAIKPEHKLVVIASDDSFVLGVLSSALHVVWSLAAGSRLVDRPVYSKSTCFDPFPFPDCTEKQRQRIRDIAEELDAHRKRQQAKYPDLTLTDMYNVLEKLRAAEKPKSGADAPVGSPSSLTTDHQPLTTPSIHSAAFSPKDKQIHDRGLISILKQLHDDLDTAVFQAYNWSPNLTDDQLLENLVQLNHQRAAEEAQGQVRHLRPDFQKPRAT